MIVLSREPGGLSLYQQLYRQLRGQIARGEIQAGQKLPAKRAMAQQLNISVNTVDGAYRQLESEGYIAARPRSGFYVCQIEALAPHSTAPVPTAAAPVRSAPVAVDFSPGGIAAEKFPLRRWQQLLRACAEGLQILSRTPADGDPALRSAICQYIFEARGVRCTPAQMILGAGTDSLLQRLSYLLPNRCAFAVENPVYNQAYRLFARMGHPVVPVEIDHSGVTVEKLEQLDEAVVYTTPSHQYPLGLCMPMARRAQLLNWCSRGAFRYVIEDDYDSEFRYDSRPVPSLQSIDHSGRVIYLGTFSRSVCPGLRISYMVLPEPLLQRYQAACRYFACGVSSLEQAALREFILCGDFARHVNRMRVYYKGQRRYFLQRLEPFGSGIESIGEAAGHHLAVRVHNGMNEAALCQAALAQGARVYPISPYFIGTMPAMYESKVLLGFGGLSRGQIDQGCALLERAWF